MQKEVGKMKRYALYDIYEAETAPGELICESDDFAEILEAAKLRQQETDGECALHAQESLSTDKGTNERLMKDLHYEADYALKSHSRNLVYQAYGKALMACDLGAISYRQFKELNQKLVVDGLNNYAKSKLE